MTAKRTEEPQAGIAARYDADCPRCPNGIVPGDRIVFQHGDAVHAACYAKAHE